MGIRRIHEGTLENLFTELTGSRNKGWFIEEPNYTCYLRNMNTREKKTLPDLPDKYGYLRHIILTAPPPNAPQPCFVFFLIANRCFLLFCRPGDDEWKKWRYDQNQQEKHSLSDAVKCNDKVYVLYGPTSRLCEIEILGNGDGDGVFNLKRYDAILPVSSPFSTYRLVESCGELFVVWRKSIFDINVFKMDFSQNQNRWQQVFNLSPDRCFALRCGTSTSFSPPELGGGVDNNTIFLKKLELTIVDRTSIVTEEKDDDQSLYSFNLADMSLSVSRVRSGATPWTLHDQIMTIRNGKVICFKRNNLQDNWFVLGSSSISFPSDGRQFLACYQGELMSVWIDDQRRDSIHVFKLNSEGDGWVQTKSLDDKILYLSQTTTLTVEAMSLSPRVRNTVQLCMFSEIHGKDKNAGNISYSFKDQRFHVYKDSIQGYSPIGDLFDTKEIFLRGTWIQPLVQPHAIWNLRRGRIEGKNPPPGQCNQENDSDCCKDGKWYTIYTCSPPVSTKTKATLTLNSFEAGGDGGGPSECDNQYHSDDDPVVALSTGWFNHKKRCLKYINIYGNGKSVRAKVVDECDSTMGCDSDHDYQPPCPNNIVDASKAVWKALEVPESDWGDIDIYWSDTE
ncbi:Barwin-related endoglucanase [Corchorus capsularis]|uniref:Barwin-related endoglucanase n=1 Tax=Corchorus capsularis TaxID=210143 RepID=A0A1R3I855_COCAP|nr:Barwin-related endoglucanase [Corchorus capsularis]